MNNKTYFWIKVWWFFSGTFYIRGNTIKPFRGIHRYYRYGQPKPPRAKVQTVQWYKHFTYYNDNIKLNSFKCQHVPKLAKTKNKKKIRSKWPYQNTGYICFFFSKFRHFKSIYNLHSTDSILHSTYRECLWCTSLRRETSSNRLFVSVQCVYLYH